MFNRLVAEYALRGIAKLMSVAEYQLLREVPQPLATDLPSIEDIEAELGEEELAAIFLVASGGEGEDRSNCCLAFCDSPRPRN